MTSTQNARQGLRKVLEGGECVFPASVFGPFSVRIADEIGYEMGMFGGSVASLTVLGAPDAILLTLTELADQCRRRSRAGDLPIFVDADHGYGNSLNAMRTVEELENAGVAGLSVEDTELPLQFGRPDGKHLLSVEEGASKVAAAVAARQDPNLVIAGRTDAAGITGIEDVIERLAAYEKAGADILFAVGIKQPEDVQALSNATSKPLMLGGLPVEHRDHQALAKQRVRICLQGHQPFAAAAQAAYNTLKALRDGVLPADLDGVADGKTMQRWMNNDEYIENVEKYLK